MAQDVSVLVGGKAGDGINSAGAVVAQLLNSVGYHTCTYYEYPSLIRGGHNFAIIRGADHPVDVHRNMVDYVIALNMDTISLHSGRFHEKTVTVFNSDVVKALGQGISVSAALTSENAPAIMGNSALIGAFASSAGIPWDTVSEVFNRHIPKGADINLRVARKGYDQVTAVHPINRIGDRRFSLISGNEAIALGLIHGGLSAYVSYPMTPSSSLLHFLAEHADRFGITVIHPENEIAVILMALGISYAGGRPAIGTSGGGFCLMTEGLSLAGMAEIPLVIVVSQRTGPSTGLPTFTGQSDLHFILHAGQGEFPRFVVAPGTAREAYAWSAVAMDIAGHYQVPAFILADKTLSEGTFSLDPVQLPEVPFRGPVLWDGSNTYRRYADNGSGVSPQAFPGTRGAVVKVNSYAHDETGITTEEAAIVAQMTRKRLRKAAHLAEAMEAYDTVITDGPVHAGTMLVCWGSVQGACTEAAHELGLRAVRPVVLSPFPEIRLKQALEGARRLISVEENATGQLAALLRLHGITVDTMVLHYDGRPLTPEMLVERLKEAGV